MLDVVVNHVRPINSLRDSRYARTLMDKLMAADEAARDRPEYLDTWATTYAATGDFVTAIDKQCEELILGILKVPCAFASLVVLWCVGKMLKHGNRNACPLTA